MPSRRATVLFAVLLYSAAAGVAQTDPRAKALCAQVPGIAAELTDISGMKLRHPVPCDFITKEQVNQFLQKRIKDTSTPDEVRAEELTLKKFGLIPPDFDLAKNEVELLTEQAAAFYDYDKKKLFITDSTSSESQAPVLAHELSHALADQNYNLARFIKQGRKSDDGSTARLAVMEGQATWLMSEYLARQAGTSLRDSATLAATMAQVAGDDGDKSQGDSEFPVFDKEPLYLKLTLVFPYTKGMVFQQAVLARDPQTGFGEVFLHPPVSTQQILHPDKYFAHVQPTDPALPAIHLPHGYKGLVGGQLGELEQGILLEQYVGKTRAGSLAPHWRGCNFELQENKKAGRVVLLYSTEWDSDESAAQYFTAYREVMHKKWKKMAVATDTADALTGTGDDGRFELRRKGAIVTAVEGLAPEIH
ncbi:MAG TPA: hypothetical protein VHW09_25685 [Bryobacteraceae bacterium]|nr:hypothetical protein [Bryobacteraceae bacterium]